MNYYERLGIKPNASVQDIRRAYRDLSKLYHPDTTQLESAIAIPKFQALNEAYATLSSPEKRLTYDYKTGFSRLSVMQSFAQGEDSPIGSARANADSPTPQYSGNAYLDPTDRPLSAGEFFALFLLGITFIACLLLVLMLSLTKGDVTLNALDLRNLDLRNLDLQNLDLQNLDRQPSATQTLDPQILDPQDSLQPNVFQSDSIYTAPELPQAPWLVPKSRSLPPVNPSASPF